MGTRPTHTASYPPLRPGDLSRGLHHHHPCSPPLPASSIVAGPFIPSYLSFADAAPPSGELNARPLHTLPLCHNSQTSPCRTPRTPTNHAELPGRRRHAVVVAKPFGLADRCVCARRPVLSGTRRPRSCFRRTTRAGLLPPRGRASGAPPSQSRGVCAFNVSFQKRCLQRHQQRGYQQRGYQLELAASWWHHAARASRSAGIVHPSSRAQGFSGIQATSTS